MYIEGWSLASQGHAPMSIGKSLDVANMPSLNNSYPPQLTQIGKSGRLVLVENRTSFAEPETSLD